MKSWQWVTWPVRSYMRLLFDRWNIIQFCIIVFLSADRSSRWSFSSVIGCNASLKHRHIFSRAQISGVQTHHSSSGNVEAWRCTVSVAGADPVLSSSASVDHTHRLRVVTASPADAAAARTRLSARQRLGSLRSVSRLSRCKFLAIRFPPASELT